MKKISSIALAKDKLAKQRSREFLAKKYDVHARIAEHQSSIELLNQVSVRELDRRVKHGKKLTFAESFCGMCHVIAGTNRHFYHHVKPLIGKAYDSDFTQERAIACGVAFMQLMATKESLNVLTDEEVAGIAAASLLDVVVRLPGDQVIETCGMGGDKGFKTVGEARKTINISTLSAIVLAGCGLKAIKHGSYGNTTKVGSTEAIELFGAKIDHTSLEEIIRIWESAGFIYLDAHLTKTIHDLSHLLMMETINHIAGPMSIPLEPSVTLHKVMGVNEKVHPGTVASAYTLLHQHQRQKMGGVAIITGLSADAGKIDPSDLAAVRAHSVIDELSPYQSVVALSYGPKFIGNFLISPADFDLEIDPLNIMIVNDKEVIQKANSAALSGENPVLADYLAMNAALGYLAHNYLSSPDLILNGRINKAFLVESFRACRQAIASGKAMQVVRNYVSLTGGHFKR